MRFSRHTARFKIGMCSVSKHLNTIIRVEYGFWLYWSLSLGSKPCINAGMTDQCIAVAKPCGYESHFITTSAAPLLPFINLWCLGVGVQ